MPDRAQDLVVVLYEHSLLGEGIARILLGETDVEVTAAPVSDRGAVEAALAREPGVVIFERCQLCREGDLAQRVPNALLIDVSPAMGTVAVAPESAAGLDGIIMAVRGAPDPPPRP